MHHTQRWHLQTWYLDTMKTIVFTLDLLLRAVQALMASDAIGCVLIAKGICWMQGVFGEQQALATSEVYDLDTNVWQAVPDNMTYGRYRHQAVLLQDYNVVVMGGQGSQSQALASTELLSIATGLWETQVCSLPSLPTFPRHLLNPASSSAQVSQNTVLSAWCVVWQPLLSRRAQLPKAAAPQLCACRAGQHEQCPVRVHGQPAGQRLGPGRGRGSAAQL